MWCGGESEKYKTSKKRNKDFSFQTQVEPGWLFFPPQGPMHPVCAHLLHRSFSASLSYLLHRPSLLSASILSGCQLSYPRPHTDKANPLLLSYVPGYLTLPFLHPLPIYLISYPICSWNNPFDSIFSPRRSCYIF